MRPSDQRTHAWFGKHRRHARDHERTTTPSEAMRAVSMIHLMLRRLAPDKGERRARFTYKRTPPGKSA